MSLRMTRRQVLVGTAVTATAGAAVTLTLPSDAESKTGHAPLSQERVSASLDSGWRFHRADVAGAEQPGFDDSGWTPVDVPHTWNNLDGQDGGKDYYRGVGWYRRHYTAPVLLVGKKLWLEFDGVNAVADVYLNGVLLGRHAGGYARFRFDASAMHLGADNVIAVKVTNAHDPAVPPLDADYTFCGGIYRAVRLQATDPLCVHMLDDSGPGVYVQQRSISAAAATVDVTCQGWNHSDRSCSVAVRTVIADASWRVVADVTKTVGAVHSDSGFQSVQRLTIPEPHLWQGTTDPYQYRVTVEINDTVAGIVTDAVSEPLGLRTYAVDPDKGFLLNGVPYRLRGVSRHQDRLNLGWAIGDAEHTQDFDLMDEMGVNALRTAHYQQDQKVYELADERGYVVWAEAPNVSYITEAAAQPSAAYADNIRQQLRELIKQNYNHPSVCFWGIGNEQRPDDAATNKVLATLAADALALDPGRLSAYAQSGGGTSGLTDHSRVTAFNYYNGWYGGSITDMGPWADALHRNQPTRGIAVSEYGAGGSIGQHEENPSPPNPEAVWHPEEYQTRFHEQYWAQIKARPFLWATFVWNMFDFASDYRNEGDTPGRNDKGLVTYDRATRKDAFYWYKANWTSTPFVHVTSRRWTSRTVAATTVKVYANGVDTVRLKLNGAEVGPPQVPAEHIFSWPIKLARGENLIEVFGTQAGGQSYTDSVKWRLQ